MGHLPRLIAGGAGSRWPRSADLLDSRRWPATGYIIGPRRGRGDRIGRMRPSGYQSSGRSPKISPTIARASGRSRARSRLVSAALNQHSINVRARPIEPDGRRSPTAIAPLRAPCAWQHASRLGVRRRAIRRLRQGRRGTGGEARAHGAHVGPGGGATSADAAPLKTPSDGPGGFCIGRRGSRLVPERTYAGR